GDWKLHLFHEEWVLDGGWGSIATNHAVELYNLKSDIGERHDLANENPAMRDALLRELLDWQTAIHAPLPMKPNPAYHQSVAPSTDRKPLKASAQGEPMETGTPSPANRTDLFKRKDVDHDGRLSLEEFRAEKHDDEAARVNFERWDSDEDGYLSPEEFITMGRNPV
ncbi:MAG: hypothetical protein ABIZ04_19890, partial [Opitutus sp.]